MACREWRGRPWWLWLVPKPRRNSVLWPNLSEPRRVPYMSPEVEEWLASEQAHGFYQWRAAWIDARERNRGHPEPGQHDMGYLWYFSDPDTAFEFKLRFG